MFHFPLLGLVTGRSRALRSLDQDLQGYRLVGQRTEGLKTVLVSRVVGSEGRTRDFDRDFRPLTEHTRQRWCRIACAQMTDVGLPPVELIRIGEAYYVRDGNHRVSVARAFGQVAIEAEVTAYQVVSRTAGEQSEPVTDRVAAQRVAA